MMKILVVGAVPSGVTSEQGFMKRDNKSHSSFDRSDVFNSKKMDSS